MMKAKDAVHGETVRPGTGKVLFAAGGDGHT